MNETITKDVVAVIFHTVNALRLTSESIDFVCLNTTGIIDDATRSELLLLSDALHTLLRTVAPRKGENILN